MSMLPMRSPDWKKFALMYDPGHQQHGWVFYDNYGTWVTLRRATEREMHAAETLANSPSPQDAGEGR